MGTFMNGATVVEAALLSFPLALGLTWIGLRGLFRLMPATSSPAAGRIVEPIQFVTNLQLGTRRRDAK